MDLTVKNNPPARDVDEFSIEISKDHPRIQKDHVLGAVDGALDSHREHGA